MNLKMSALQASHFLQRDLNHGLTAMAMRFCAFGALDVQQSIEANEDQAVRQFAIMEGAGFNIGKDRPQRSTGNCRRLIGPNHQSQRPAVFAPIFDGLIAPPDYQEALSLDCNLFALAHRFQS